jgi:Pectinacetylesterase
MLHEPCLGRNVRAVKTLRLIGQVLVTSVVVVGFAACGSSSPVAATGAADGGKEAATTTVHPDAGLGPDAAPLDTTAIPIAGMPAMTWQWVPVEGAICRDGSATGIAVNLNPSSKNLMIFLQGGGACFNALTCGMNPKTFGMAEFTTQVAGAMGSGGLLSRTDTANPVADWNFVFVPFCTGDVHAGNRRDVTISGYAGMQQFVGYVNMTRYLARIVPTFPGLTKVLLTGVSAGGFGAAANYPQTARAFGSVPVYDIDDSGPPMEDPYVPKCLQQEWATLWGFDKTILAECGADCPDHTNYTLDATIHAAKQFPNVPLGLVEDTDDSVITLFYGFGNNNCTAALASVSATMFTAGLLDSRMKLAAYSNFGSFIFQGTAHTSLGATSTYDTVMAGGGDAATVQLSDWVKALVNGGTVTNVGP